MLKQSKGSNFSFAFEGQLKHEASSSGGTCRNIKLLADSAGAIRNGVSAAAKGKKRKRDTEEEVPMVDSLTKDDGVLVSIVVCLCALVRYCDCAFTRLTIHLCDLPFTCRITLLSRWRSTILRLEYMLQRVTFI